jgi:hypothetical protein
VGDVAEISPDVARVKSVNDSVCAEGFVNPPRASTAAVDAASEQVALSVIVTVCPEPDGVMPLQAPLKPETFLKDGDAGTVTFEEKTTVIVEAVVNAPEVDGVKPTSHESATAAAVVVGTNVTFVSEAAPAVNVTVSDGLTALVSTDVARVKPPGWNVWAEGFVKPPSVKTIGVDVDVCEQVPFSVMITVWLVVEPVIPEQAPVKPETAVKAGDAGTLSPEGKTTVMVDAAVNVPLDDDVKPMVQVVAGWPATGDDGEKVTDEDFVAGAVCMITAVAVGLAGVWSDDVATVKPLLARVCAEGFVSPPIWRTAAVDPVSAQVPLSVIVTVSTDPTPAILEQLPVNPETTETEGDAGTLKGKTMVTVDVPESAPFKEEVKPTFHGPTNPATAAVPLGKGVTVTLVGAWVP